MGNKRVWIAQLLCPLRHCIIAAAAECERDGEVADLIGKVQRQFDELVASKQINPWCGICPQRELSVEAGRTRFESLEESRTELGGLEMRQIFTAEYLRRHGRDN